MEGSGTAKLDGSQSADPKDGKKIGVVTSGGFSPILNGPISMGYVEAAHSEPGHVVDLMVRGVPRAATIVPLPFVPHQYHRPKKRS